MAFSPFTWFRKHQKVIFAGLTVLCMLVFIGQAGVGADIFQTMLRWFGAGKGGTPVITLSGKKIYEPDLTQAAMRRKMASDFLQVSTFPKHNTALESIEKKVPPPAPGNLLEGLREIAQHQLRLRTNPEEINRDLGILMGIYARLQDAAKQKDGGQIDPEHLEMLANVATVLNYQAWFFERLRTPGLSFPFGGTAKADDLLDFMVWQHQADKLGITLTDADVAREVNREAAGQQVLDPTAKAIDKEKAITEFLRNREYEKQSPRELLDALREEFRVVLAKGLLLGTEPGVRSFRSRLDGGANPAVGTPDEFLEYYRKQRTTLTVKMLPIAVRDFLDKVTKAPSEEELRRRFNRFKDDEPSPTRRDPAFKEPRRITVEYLAGSADDPFYRKKARAWTDAWKNRAGLSIGSVLTTPFGAPPAARLAVVGSALAFDPLAMAYEKYVKEEPSWITPTQDLTDRRSQTWKVRTNDVLNRYNLISTLGVMLGSLQGAGSPLAAPLSLAMSASFDEVKGSLKQNLAMLLARSNTQDRDESSFDSSRGALTQNPLTAVALVLPFSPKFLPRSRMEPILLAALEDKLAEEALQQNLETVRTELGKLRTKDRKASRDYLTKAAKDYHLTLHSMSKPLPRHVMLEQLEAGKSLGIGELREAFLSSPFKPKLEDFVNDLFQRGGTYDLQSVVKPEWGRREFLYWRSEDHPPRTRTFAEARQEVEAAWRFAEARKLALAEAERLEATINKEKMSPSKAADFLAKQNLGTVFVLDNIAPLTSPLREVHPLIPVQYFRYQAPPDKLPHAPSDLVKQLMELQRPGQATVIVDQPASHFFVTVLVSRNEPTLKEFLKRYDQTLLRDPLYTRFLDSQTEQFNKTVLTQLRREATDAVDEEGRYKLPESIRKPEQTREEE
jgi:hypothetical protein